MDGQIVFRVDSTRRALAEAAARRLEVSLSELVRLAVEAYTCSVLIPFDESVSNPRALRRAIHASEQIVSEASRKQ